MSTFSHLWKGLVFGSSAVIGGLITIHYYPSIWRSLPADYQEDPLASLTDVKQAHQQLANKVQKIWIAKDGIIQEKGILNEQLKAQFDGVKAQNKSLQQKAEQRQQRFSKLQSQLIEQKAISLNINAQKEVLQKNLGETSQQLEKLQKQLRQIQSNKPGIRFVFLKLIITAASFVLWYAKKYHYGNLPIEWWSAFLIVAAWV